MKYYSLLHQSPEVNFKEAAVFGQAPDGGLYFPASIPEPGSSFYENIEKLSREEVAFEVIAPFVGNSIPQYDLKKILSETIQFDIPTVALTDRVRALELFHGPTLAFKDVGARFMSRCLGYFVGHHPAEFKKKITVLVATSGDTGGAVANGFYGVEGVEVVILYPSGKVSSVQEKQLTTLGKNVKALEILGTFDDCQAMVKQAFSDPQLKKELFLTSANSINIARWLSQQIYYFLAYRDWEDKDNPPVISVPSGNFGNICAGLLAHKRGLPVNHFIAACNANEVFPKYLLRGEYAPAKSVSTLSNAMDVGNPSNFVRILQLFDQQYSSLKNCISSYSISDEETRDAIRQVKNKTEYLMDPHGAVAWVALQKYLDGRPDLNGLFLETAHPVKFYDVVETITGHKIPLPPEVEKIMKKESLSLKMKPVYQELKSFLSDTR